MNNKHAMKSNFKPVGKRTFQQAGKWVERPRKSEVLLCTCGNKYIKTREKQTSMHSLYQSRCPFGGFRQIKPDWLTPLEIHS
jgi:hypothetical protein